MKEMLMNRTLTDKREEHMLNEKFVNMKSAYAVELISEHYQREKKGDGKGMKCPQ